MSFFGKFKPGSTPGHSTNLSPTKKDPNAPQLTALEKLLADSAGGVRQDGSDKFFGFENYGSTCYCNSIIQCLYYSAPFRESVLNFPSKSYLEHHKNGVPDSENLDSPVHTNGTPLSPRLANSAPYPYPNPSSPARKPAVAPAGAQQKPEENKDSPEYKKRMAIQAGPVLDMTLDNSKKYGMDESLFTSLKDIFETVIGHQSRIGVVSPYKFLEILRRENEMFRSAMHQDAHEFLNLLLNQVVDSVDLFSKQLPTRPLPHVNGGPPESGLAETAPKDSAVSPSSINGIGAHWLHDIFEGLLTSETRCLTCENTSQRDEAFLDLSVDLSPHTSVTSCLRKFSEEEMLCERNKFHCDNCGGLQEAEKRMKIKRLPRVLALHLKRFKYTEDLQRLQKLFHRVAYPFHLRLFNTTEDASDPDRLYELYAVVVHIGGGPYHGHYVSIIKTQDRGWLLFDDELVEPVDKSYVLNFFGGEPVPGVQDAKQLACAYILFYQETTLEAVLKEQEAEGHPTQASARTSDAEAKEAMSPTKNPLNTPSTHMTPNTPEADTMEPLAQSFTAPQPITVPLSAQITNTPSDYALPALSQVKSKKELKQEEKERKAAQKAEEKATALKRKEASERRVEAIRKSEEELRRVLEASKQSASDEAKKRGNESAKDLRSRFARPGSVSLKSRPKFLGGKDKDKEHVPPAASNTQQPVGESGEDLTALPPPVPAIPVTEGKPKGEKKNRFSLGRKRSALLA